MTLTNVQNASTRERSRFGEELSIVPGWAYVLAVAVFITMFIVFFGIFRGQPGGHMPILATAVPFIGATFLAFFALMIGYVNRDAGRRGMSRTLWTLIVIFVPNAIGFILYFILREPIRTQCPKCAAVVDPRSNYCPSCRYAFHPTCDHCKASVRPTDTFCANCGAKVAEGS